MHENYNDITKRINEQPKWYDANGTPRYDEFKPDMCPNIYSSTVVLLLITCQSCNLRFKVELHSNAFSPIEHPHKLHYGDPPIHGCVGDTMNCEDIAVLEVWHKDKFEWVRHTDLEGDID